MASEGLTPSLAGDGIESLVPVDAKERNFGRYSLRYELAAGGMATVYLARARGPAGFDRAAAIKRIHPHLAKRREFVEMFLDEARLSARITHPNVCSVVDFGEVDGTYFMAMEYLVGQPVSALLRAVSARPELTTTPRWYALVAKIISDACEGLHAAHELRDERGKPLCVVHRDVTPHNIFLTYDGAVKVVDFGVAFAEGRLHHTATGTLKGKLAYMSPEQARGKDIDRRLDVWALGVCLWELLAVQRLFPKGAEVEILHAVVYDEIRPPSDVRSGVPAALDAIALKALDRDLALRYPTARAMARDLNAFVSSAGVSAGTADLAELMEELFAAERATKLGVMASVLETGSEPLELDDPTESGSRLAALPEQEPPTQAFRPALPPAPTVVRDEPVAPPVLAPIAPLLMPPPPVPAAPSSRTRWMVGAGALVVVALVSLGLFAMHAPPVEISTPLAIVPPVRQPPVAPQPTPPIAPGITRTADVPIAVPTPTPPPATDTTPTTPVRHPDQRSRGTGTVNVAARGGWADIYLNGERLGRTPRSLTLPAGRHVLELRPSGELPAQRVTAIVRSGETARVIVDL